VKGVKIAVSYDLGLFTVSDAILANTLATVQALRDLGAEVALPWTAETLTAFSDRSATIFGTWVAPYLAEHRHEMTDYAIALGERGQRVTAQDFLRSIEVEAQLWEGLVLCLKPMTCWSARHWLYHWCR